MLASYEFAQVQFTRFRLVRWRAGGVRFARLCRKAKHRLFAAISLSQALLPPDSCLLLQLRQNRWHSKNNRSFANLAVGWLRECSDLSGHRSTQRQGDKRSAAADLIASNAPLRDGTHKARQNPVPHELRGIKGGRNPLCTPFSSIFRRATKDGAPGGRIVKNAAGKNVKPKKHPER